MELYSDPIIKKYIELFKAAFGEGVIKRYFQGDPIMIPESNLPAMAIAKDETRVGPLSNSEDEYNIAMTITVVTSIRAELNDDKTLQPGIAQLYDIIEGRNADYTLKSNSVLNILRTNINVDTANNLRTDLGSITRVNYGLTVGKRAPEAWAVEATIEFMAHFSQIR